MNGATVTNLADDSSATTVAAPGQGDGFYSLFAAGSGSQAFEATADLHTSLTKNADVTADAVVRLDFSLAAGLLDAGPRPLSAIVSPGGTQSLTLDVTNTGTGDGSFVIHEVDVPPPAEIEPVFASLEDQREARRAFPAAGFSGFGAKPLRPLPNAPIDAPQTAGAGNVVSSFETDLCGSIRPRLRHRRVNRLWVTNSSAAGSGQLDGDGLEYQYQPDGTQTGETIDIGSVWLGDGAYNARTGMIWQPNVAFNDQFPNSMPRRDRSGDEGRHGQADLRSLDQLPGAYGSRLRLRDRHVLRGRPVRRHHSRGQRRKRPRLGQHRAPDLGPGVQPDHPDPVRRHVHDRAVRHLAGGPGAAATAVLSGFDVKSNGVPVLNTRGVSLESDCNGHLWVMHVDDKTVYEVESGERGWCVGDIPWLSEDPAEGTIPGSGGGSSPAGAGNTLPVTVTFDSAGLLPGLSPPLARLHDGHAGPGRAGAGRPHRPLQRRAGGQLRLELHLRRGRSRRHAGLQPVRAGVRLLPDGSRDAPEHGRLHRARGPWRR